jgi:hypothetical protein
MRIASNLLTALLAAWVGVLLALSTGCASVTKIPTPRGDFVHVAAVGEGAMASDCSGAGEWPSIEQAATPAEAKDLTPQQLEELRFSQYVDGKCIAARGSSISKELEGVLRYYLYTKAIGLAGKAIGGMVDMGTTDATADATTQVIEAESEAAVETIGAEAAAAAAP